MRALPTVVVLLALLLGLGLLYGAAGAVGCRLSMPMVLRNAPLFTPLPPDGPTADPRVSPYPVGTLRPTPPATGVFDPYPLGTPPPSPPATYAPYCPYPECTPWVPATATRTPTATATRTNTPAARAYLPLLRRP